MAGSGRRQQAEPRAISRGYRPRGGLSATRCAARAFALPSALIRSVQNQAPCVGLKAKLLGSRVELADLRLELLSKDKGRPRLHSQTLRSLRVDVARRR